MTKKLTFDLPQGFAEKENSATLLDANHSVYYLQAEGDAKVYVEKWSVKKINYEPLPVGTRKSNNASASLIKEDSYTDIGGGICTFLRHYALTPVSWFDYESVQCLLYNSYGISQGNRVGINYDYGGGQNPWGFGFFGFLTGFYRRDMTFTAKATRYYVPADVFETSYTDGKLTIENTQNYLYSYIYPHGVSDNTVTTFENSSGSGYRIATLPNLLFFHEPRWVAIVGNATVGVVAPDRIVKWHNAFYEITRYTSNIDFAFVTDAEASESNR